MSSPSDEAQRDLERRALRNVRNLVDKMEQTDQVDERSQKRLLLAIFAGAVVVVVAIAATILFRGQPQPVVIDTAKLPPVQAGPRK